MDRQQQLRFDWCVVGAGIHGMAVAHRLSALGREVVVVDPWLPFTVFVDRITSMGMTHLTSNADKHLGLRGERPYQDDPETRTPTVPDVLDHLNDIAASCTGKVEFKQTTARSFSKNSSGQWVLQTNGPSIVCNHLVLALGQGEPERTPFHVHHDSYREPRRILTVLDPRWQESIPEGAPVVVVGGGLSWAHSLMTLHKRGHEVTGLYRSRIEAYTPVQDAAPSRWSNIHDMDWFHVMSAADRWRAITETRDPGSMPAFIFNDLMDHVKRGLKLVQTHIAYAHEHADVIQVMCEDDTTHDAHSVVLATGFARVRPGGDWLTRCIESNGLPIAPCGFADVGRGMQWVPGLWVTGRLGELGSGFHGARFLGAQYTADVIEDWISARP